MTLFTPTEIIAAYYVGYYNRAPDPIGFDFWLNAFQTGTPRLDIANFFADQDETRALYPYFADAGSSSPVDFVTSVYNNLFDRGPDIGGLNFWVDQLNSGGVQVGQMIEAIIEGATTNPDLAVVQNKIDAALYWENAAFFTSGFFYDADDAASASSVLDSVTADPGSVGVAQFQTDSFFADAYGSGGSGNFDTGGSFSDPVVLQPGDAFFGEIEFEGDEDWFLLTLEDEAIYYTDVFSDDIRNIALTAFDPAGFEFQADGFSFSGQPFEFTGADIFAEIDTTGGFLDAGTYLLRLDNGFAGPGEGNLGSYGFFTGTLSLPSNGDDDFVGNVNTSGFVSTNQTVTFGDIEQAYDTDWFRISFVEGRSYQINVDGQNDVGGLGDPVLDLYDPRGGFIGENDDANGTLNSEFTYTAQETGIHFVGVRGFSDNFGDYLLYADNLSFV